MYKLFYIVVFTFGLNLNAHAQFKSPDDFAVQITQYIAARDTSDLILQGPNTVDNINAMRSILNSKDQEKEAGRRLKDPVQAAKFKSEFENRRASKLLEVISKIALINKVEQATSLNLIRFEIMQDSSREQEFIKDGGYKSIYFFYQSNKSKRIYSIKCSFLFPYNGKWYWLDGVEALKQASTIAQYNISDDILDYDSPMYYHNSPSQPTTGGLQDNEKVEPTIMTKMDQLDDENGISPYSNKYYKGTIGKYQIGMLIRFARIKKGDGRILVSPRQAIYKYSNQTSYINPSVSENDTNLGLSENEGTGYFYLMVSKHGYSGRWTKGLFDSDFLQVKIVEADDQVKEIEFSDALPAIPE